MKPKTNEIEVIFEVVEPNCDDKLSELKNSTNVTKRINFIHCYALLID
jgi:hypothetical protein